MPALTFSTFLLIYIFGGITLLPLIVGAVLLHLYFSPIIEHSGSRPEDAKSDNSTVRDEGQSRARASDLDGLPADLPEELRAKLELGRKRKEEEGKTASGTFTIYRDWPGSWTGRPRSAVSEEELVAGEEPAPASQEGQSKQKGWQGVYKTLFDRKKNSSQASVDSGKGDVVYGSGGGNGRARGQGNRILKGGGTVYFVVLR